jgi:two-component system OmpR family response regulator
MPRSSHILLVEDDRDIRGLLGRYLTEQGFRVTQVQDGRGMIQALAASRIDLVILDLMLPGEDGLSLCRKLRSTSSIPVVMVTAKTEEVDRIIGLEIGADDYLAKPFNPRELLARVRAVLRRSQGGPTPPPGADKAESYWFDGWRANLTQRTLQAPDGSMVGLSSGEFDLLVAFLEHPQRVLSRDQLLDIARGRASVLFDRSIDVQISRLRRKIEPDPQNPMLIKTVRNSGYLFTGHVTSDRERQSAAP